VQLLRENGVEPEIVEYLKTPLSENQLRDLASKMKLQPRDFIRSREAEYKEMKLKEKLDDADILFKAMAQAPKLMERPIAQAGKKAVLGRPPVRVLELL